MIPYSSHILTSEHLKPGLTEARVGLLPGMRSGAMDKYHEVHIYIIFEYVWIGFRACRHFHAPPPLTLVV